MYIKHTFKDRTGLVRTDAAVFIENIMLDYKNHYCTITTCFYNSMDDRDKGESPICSENVRISGADFTNYFYESVLSAVDTDPMERAYNLLMNRTGAELSSRFDFKASGTLINQ